MATEIDIINNALTKIGAATIATLSDSSREGRLANRTYNDLRDDVLRDYQWNFATKRFSIAANATAPLWEYDNAYTLPSDFLRLTGLNNPSNYDYRIEMDDSGNRIVVTDISSPLQGVYIARVSNAEQMDPKFREALSARLAMEWAEPLTASGTLLTKMTQLYQQKMADARTVDGAEDSFNRQPDSGAWIDARY